MKINYTKGKGSMMIRSEKRCNFMSILKKLFLLTVFLCVSLIFSSCNKYAKEETLMVEEQGVKYYFVGEEGDYLFKRAFLIVCPNERIKKEIIENKAELTISRESEDEWKVSLEDTVPYYSLNGKENYFEETYGFSCIGDFSEESLLPGRLFDDSLQDHYYITDGFVSSEKLMEIVKNGERISIELNEQSGK